MPAQDQHVNQCMVSHDRPYFFPLQPSLLPLLPRLCTILTLWINIHDDSDFPGTRRYILRKYDSCPLSRGISITGQSYSQNLVLLASTTLTAPARWLGLTFGFPSFPLSSNLTTRYQSYRVIILSIHLKALEPTGTFKAIRPDEPTLRISCRDRRQGEQKTTGGLQPVMSVLLSNRAQQALVLRLSSEVHSTSERHASFLA